MRVAYQRDWSAYTVVSAADILDQASPASATGRLVLVGSSSLGLGDRVATPSGDRPGLGVQAAVLSALLDRRPACAGALARPLDGVLFALSSRCGAATPSRACRPWSVGLLGGARRCGWRWPT